MPLLLYPVFPSPEPSGLVFTSPFPLSVRSRVCNAWTLCVLDTPQPLSQLPFLLDDEKHPDRTACLILDAECDVNASLDLPRCRCFSLAASCSLTHQAYRSSLHFSLVSPMDVCCGRVTAQQHPVRGTKDSGMWVLLYEITKNFT